MEPASGAGSSQGREGNASGLASAPDPGDTVRSLKFSATRLPVTSTSCSEPDSIMLPPPSRVWKQLE